MQSGLEYGIAWLILIGAIGGLGYAGYRGLKWLYHGYRWSRMLFWLIILSFLFIALCGAIGALAGQP